MMSSNYIDEKHLSNVNATFEYLMVSVNLITTFSPIVSSESFTSVPEERFRSYPHPVFESERIEIFIPRFKGFSGEYCFREDGPSNLAIASSIL